MSARLTLGLLLLAGVTGLEAQSVRVAGGFGPVIPVGAFEDGDNLARLPIDASLSFRLEWGWRTNDARPGIHESGLGVLAIDFPDTNELGHPITVYGFTHLPLFDLGETAVRLDAALGVSVGWREFDPVDNPYQVSIGSPVTAFFQMEGTAVQPLSPGLDLTLSVGYRHFSNGNLLPPNVGLNTTPLTAGLRARPADFGGGGRGGERAAGAGERSVGSAVPAVVAGPRDWSLHLLPFVGVRGFAADNRHTERDAVYVRQHLPVAGLHARASRPLNATLAWGALVGVTWDASGFRAQEIPSLAAERLEASASFALSGGVSLFVDTGPALLEFGVGYAALDVGGHREVSRWHQRLGAHLQVTDRLEPFVVLRALSADRPDFMEWGAAVRVR